MRSFNGGVRLVRGVISAVILISGAFGAKTYIDSNNKELSVDEVIKVLDSKGYNYSGILHASGSLKNISDIDNVKVTITIDFLDKDKNVLKSVEEVKDDLDAGEVWQFDVASLGRASEYYSISYIEIECE